MTSSTLTPSVFKFEESHPVRVILQNGEPWFIGNDVCAALCLGNPRSSMALLEEDEKGVHIVDTPSGQQEMTIINEPGLYSLVLRSRKPEAKKFKRWITHEVLPAIRKTGHYAVPEHPVQPELPLDSAPVPAGRFSALKYQGVEVIPADELRKRLSVTKGQFEAWLYSYKPLIDNVDVFRINGVPDKLALAMLKAGFKVNPNIISVNLYTRSGFAKAAARFASGPKVTAAEVRELPIPKRPAGTSPVREMRFELNDVLKPFSTATVTLLEKLYTAGYDTEREIAEVVFMAGAIRRMREITALAGEQIEGVNASIAVQNGRLSSSLRYERAEN